ncbi:MAG: hypothetical protein IIC33_07465 [Chloroflexi bacterium]|nr:hypothetical protein [Chloroflexota bacterium]
MGDATEDSAAGPADAGGASVDDAGAGCWEGLETSAGSATKVMEVHPARRKSKKGISDHQNNLIMETFSCRG